MGYERDKDAHTRGVGAIAAADRNRLRHARAHRRAVAMTKRDRALGAVAAMGARGGWEPIGDTLQTDSGGPTLTTDHSKGAIAASVRPGRSGIRNMSSGASVKPSAPNSSSPTTKTPPSWTLTPSGSGGGAGVVMGGGTPGGLTPTRASYPDIDQPMVDESLIPDASPQPWKKWLLLGAAGVGAYLLLRRG